MALRSVLDFGLGLKQIRKVTLNSSRIISGNSATAGQQLLNVMNHNGFLSNMLVSGCNTSTEQEIHSLGYLESYSCV